MSEYIYLITMAHFMGLTFLYFMYCIGTGLYDKSVDYLYDRHGTSCPIYSFSGASDRVDASMTCLIMAFASALWIVTLPLAIVFGIVRALLYVARSLIRLNAKVAKIEEEED